MNIVRLHGRPPVDGPKLDSRRTMIGRMATDLLRFDALASEADAVRALVGRYSPLDIARLAEDALYAARQSLAAREMTRDRRC